MFASFFSLVLGSYEPDDLLYHDTQFLAYDHFSINIGTKKSPSESR